MKNYFWLLVDQGVFAASNFVVSVFFARWLPPASYGIFAISFSGYLFMTLAHWGLFLEPLLVMSGQINLTQERAYVRALGIIHLIALCAIIILSGIILLVASVCEAAKVGEAIAGASIGGWLLLTLFTGRRLCFMFRTPQTSAVVGLLYFVGLTLSTWIWMKSGDLSWLAPWELMGFWSLVCSIVIFSVLLSTTDGSGHFPISSLTRFQRHYAPGALLNACCGWFAVDGVYVVLGSIMGLSAVAGTKAVFNIANPLVQVNSALHAAWLVRFSQKSAGTRDVKAALAIYGAIAAAFVAVLVFVSPLLVSILYKGRYVDVAWQLPLYAGSLGVMGSTAILTSWLKARGMLWVAFGPDIIGSVIATVSGLLLISWFGQPGAAYAILLGSCVSFFGALPIALRRWRSEVATGRLASWTAHS